MSKYIKFKKIKTNNNCQYGCKKIAKFIFKNSKLCCSNHYNKCKGKRENYSKIYKKEWTEKSLKTRLELNITKTCQIKGTETRKKMCHYKNLAKHMQLLWNKSPWSCGARSEFKKFKNTSIAYQGGNEYSFLEKIENKNGIDWIEKNVKRGNGLWYLDTETNTERLYLPDFIINEIIYEIKSEYTLNFKIKRNIDKFNSVIYNNKRLIIVIDGEEIEYLNEKQFFNRKSLQ